MSNESERRSAHERLRDFISRSLIRYLCKRPSAGDSCQCPLCDLDRLANFSPEKSSGKRVLCKLYGALVIAEVAPVLEGTVGACPQCDSTEFVIDDTETWVNCAEGCGFAYYYSHLIKSQTAVTAASDWKGNSNVDDRKLDSLS